MRVAILRCANLPRFVTWDIPDTVDLFADDKLLIAEFVRRGVDAQSVVWSDSGVDWNRYDLALIRSTWDYIDDRGRFLSVLEDIEASSCRLHNPLSAVRWNTDKSYLFDLEEWRIPTVPTLPAPVASAPAIHDDVVRQGWQRVVVKPRVGAGGADIQLVRSADLVETLALLARERPHLEFIVQPLVESIHTEGELSFIYVDGQLNHVLQKKPAAGDYRSHGMYGGTMDRIEPQPDDRAQAGAIMAKLPFDLLYARLDLVRVGGRLAVMELELIEPILYFDFAPAGVGQLVTATLARLQRPGR